MPYIYIGFWTIILITIWMILQTEPNSKLPVSNETFVNTVTKTSSRIKEEDLSNFFQSGRWASHYFQYEQWHGPHIFLLSFNDKDLTVTGSGKDNIGAFSIDGIYSHNTGRLGLTKQYRRGTGDPFENIGHTVIIQLEWNFERHQFDGKWYIDMKNYREQDNFQLEFDRSTTVIDVQ